jgi:hypothetical protein
MTIYERNATSKANTNFSSILLLQVRKLAHFTQPRPSLGKRVLELQYLDLHNMISPKSQRNDTKV